jgi:transcription elongation factor GreA
MPRPVRRWLIPSFRDTEANLKEGKISVSTPIAQGLLGRKVGEVVDVKVPAGVLKLEILEISL